MVHTLQAQRVLSDSDVLDRILPHTHKLTTLVYTFRIDQTVSRRDFIDRQRLSDQLSFVRNTLTNLKVTYELAWECGEFANNTVINICSLKDMAVLKTLDIPFYLLLGWEPDKAPKLADVLPRSLVTLTLGEDQWCIDCRLWSGTQIVQTFVDFVEAAKWKENTPFLKLVNLDMDWTYDSEPTEELNPVLIAAERFLKHLFATNGLHCAIVRFPDQEPYPMLA